MHYYKNNLGDIVQVEDKTWNKFLKLQPGIEKDEILDYKPEVDKIKNSEPINGKFNELESLKQEVIKPPKPKTKTNGKGKSTRAKPRPKLKASGR